MDINNIPNLAPAGTGNRNLPPHATHLYAGNAHASAEADSRTFANRVVSWVPHIVLQREAGERHLSITLNRLRDQLPCHGSAVKRRDKRGHKDNRTGRSGSQGATISGNSSQRNSCLKRGEAARYHGGFTENRADRALQYLLKDRAKSWVGGSGRKDIPGSGRKFREFPGRRALKSLFDCARDGMVLPEPPKMRLRFVKRMRRGECRDQHNYRLNDALLDDVDGIGGSVEEAVRLEAVRETGAVMRVDV
ncbi:hypothetical protein C8R44DRAFT_728277 [Mycena epipterygia]|nr:hypothetical protein C8R44DRAFT_728277 [Mycena epipterygia]